jgi:hypothetical protein
MLKGTLLFALFSSSLSVSLGEVTVTPLGPAGGLVAGAAADAASDAASDARAGTHEGEHGSGVVNEILGEGFSYTNIRLETSTPLSMIEAAEAGAASAADNGSWTDKLKPWKNRSQPMPAPPVSGASGVSGGNDLLRAYDGETPPVNPQSEAEMLLAKQQLLMALLEDTEQALAAGQGK